MKPATAAAADRCPVTEHVAVVAAAVVVLRAVETRLAKLRAGNDCLHHSGAVAHVRQARKMEEQKLNELTDPKGIASLVASQAAAMLRGASAQDALRLIEGNAEGAA